MLTIKINITEYWRVLGDAADPFHPLIKALSADPGLKRDGSQYVDEIHETGPFYSMVPVLTWIAVDQSPEIQILDYRWSIVLPVADWNSDTPAYLPNSTKPDPNDPESSTVQKTWSEWCADNNYDHGNRTFGGGTNYLIGQFSYPWNVAQSFAAGGYTLHDPVSVESIVWDAPA